MKPLFLSTLKRSARATFIVAGALCVGCGSIKFYPGEERPDSEIARLLFNSSGAAMNVVTLDGTPHPQPGRTLEVMPGPHTLVVKYAQTFKGTEAPLRRYGTCTISFKVEAAQELFIFVDAVADSGLSASAPPMITIQPTGFNQPALFQERCREESKARLSNFSRDF